MTGHRPYQTELATAHNITERLHALVEQWDNQTVPSAIRSHIYKAATNLDTAVFHLDNALVAHEDLEEARRAGKADKRREHRLDTLQDQDLP